MTIEFRPLDYDGWRAGVARARRSAHARLIAQLSGAVTRLTAGQGSSRQDEQRPGRGQSPARVRRRDAASRRERVRQG